MGEFPERARRGRKVTIVEGLVHVVARQVERSERLTFMWCEPREFTAKETLQRRWDSDDNQPRREFSAMIQLQPFEVLPEVRLESPRVQSRFDDDLEPRAVVSSELAKAAQGCTPLDPGPHLLCRLPGESHRPKCADDVWRLSQHRVEPLDEHAVVLRAFDDDREKPKWVEPAAMSPR